MVTKALTRGSAGEPQVSKFRLHVAFDVFSRAAGTCELEIYEVNAQGVSAEMH